MQSLITLVETYNAWLQVFRWGDEEETGAGVSFRLGLLFIGCASDHVIICLTWEPINFVCVFGETVPLGALYPDTQTTVMEALECDEFSSVLWQACLDRIPTPLFLNFRASNSLLLSPSLCLSCVTGWGRSWTCWYRQTFPSGMHGLL